MDLFAMWIGYIVMVCLGLALGALAIGSTLNYLWSKLQLAYDFSCFQEAMREWKIAHPEKANGWNKRR